MEKIKVIKLEHVSKKLNGHLVLHDISLDVHKGEVVCIVGPSGAGKTTLLKCVDFLEIIDFGRIYIDGTLVIDKTHPHPRKYKHDQFVSYRKKIGMVFQDFNLWPHKTVLQNVTEGPRVVLKLTKPKSEEIVFSALSKVNMYDKRHKYPNSLSVGEIQRVAIARALAMGPVILLLDEITSALDPELISEIIDILKVLAREGETMLIVTHEMGFAKEVADTVILMDKGRIVEKAPPEEFFNSPREERTQLFLQKVLKNKIF